MPAAVFAREGVLELQERPIPEIAVPTDVVIEVEGCGICGTDLHILDTPPAHPATPGCIMGHEYLGRIVAVGPDVQTRQVGDRVAVAPNLTCGLCPACQAGRPNHCTRFTTLGIFRDGGLAPFNVAPERACFPLPDAVPFEDAAALKQQRVVLSGGKTIDIKLPKGVEDGTKIRLSGQGQEGPGGAGDAIVTISIAPHRFFRREGDDVRLDLPISLDEAVLGAKVKVPTVDGPVMLSVPKGSSSGKVLRLKGKGFHAKDGKRGDQLVTLMIDIPAADSEIEAFVEGWSRRGKGNPRAGLGV